jgi:hypothetical protein
MNADRHFVFIGVDLRFIGGHLIFLSPPDGRGSDRSRAR